MFIAKQHIIFDTLSQLVELVTVDSLTIVLVNVGDVLVDLVLVVMMVMEVGW